MPFDFLKRGKDTSATPGPAGRPRTGKGIAFDGLTEEWRLIGTMQLEGRLSDVLNRREAISIADVSWAPIDGSAPFTPVPGLKSIDPYDLIVVLAGEGSLPPLTEEEKAAHKVHKISYEVALEVPPVRVTGTVFLYPGSEPNRLLDRATEMFVPVTDAVVLLGDRRISDPDVDTVLINRFYLRGVEQVDRRTRAEHHKLPGARLAE